MRETIFPHFRLSNLESLIFIFIEMENIIRHTEDEETLEVEIMWPTESTWKNGGDNFIHHLCYFQFGCWTLHSICHCWLQLTCWKHGIAAFRLPLSFSGHCWLKPIYQKGIDILWPYLAMLFKSSITMSQCWFKPIVYSLLLNNAGKHLQVSADPTVVGNALICYLFMSHSKLCFNNRQHLNSLEWFIDWLKGRCKNI